MTNYAPGKPFNNNILWLRLKPKTINYTKAIFESGNQPISENKWNGGESLNLVLPDSFMDQVTHDWKPLENIKSRLLEKYATGVKELQQSTEQHKVDTPMLYTDSNRRQISLTVHLAAYEDPESEILDIVRYLQHESCPRLGVDGTEVGDPTIFQVNTHPVEFFSISNAAITSIQPTYYAPYFVGNTSDKGTPLKGPSRCELTLEFQDIEPLTKERIATKAPNKVTTSVSS